MGACGDALVVLLDGGSLGAVEVADRVIPSDGGADGAEAVSQFLLQDGGEKGTEGMAADRGAARVVD